MNRPGAFARFALLALLTSAFACTQTDSLGNGGRDDDAGAGVPDATTQSSTGSGGTASLDAGAGGAPGTDGAAGAGSAGMTGGSSLTTATSGGQAGTTPQTGGASGGATPKTSGASGGTSQVGGGSGGTNGSGGATAPVADAGVDAPAGDAGSGLACSQPNPAQVTCVSDKDQCVSTSCYCSANGKWSCTRDCRGDLPLCDAGVAPDTSDGALDGAAGCSVTSAILTVDKGASLDSYCFTGCGLPLKLFKDGNAVQLVDHVRPECGTCIERPKPTCLTSGLPVTDYAYPLALRHVVDGKCGSQDCSSRICLEPGHYRVAYYVQSKNVNGTCEDPVIELSAEFDYPQTSKVELHFPN